jgi:hypothetical protein
VGLLLLCGGLHVPLHLLDALLPGAGSALELALGVPCEHRDAAPGQDTQCKDDHKDDESDASQPQPVYLSNSEIKKVLLRKFVLF